MIHVEVLTNLSFLADTIAFSFYAILRDFVHAIFYKTSLCIDIAVKCDFVKQFK